MEVDYWKHRTRLSQVDCWTAALAVFVLSGIFAFGIVPVVTISAAIWHFLPLAQWHSVLIGSLVAWYLILVAGFRTFRGY